MAEAAIHKTMQRGGGRVGGGWFGPRRALRAATLDRAEQALVLVLWTALVGRVLVSPNGHAWLVLISEAMVLVMVLARRPTQSISRHSGDWIVALVATAAPLLIAPGPDLFPRLDPLGMALVASGNVLQFAAKLALRRSFGLAPAHRGLKTGGPYGLVRHPMYAGYLLVHIGILLLMPSWLNGAIYAIGWTAQLRRLAAEEALLGEDRAYRAYCANVRWRLVPFVY